MVLDSDLSMAGYTGDDVPAMQRRMINALQAIPGVTSVGLIDALPLNGGAPNEDIFTDETTDLVLPRPRLTPIDYKISPDYFHAAGTTLLRGRDLTWHDDKKLTRSGSRQPRVRAQKCFGSVDNAIGRFFKPEIGTRLQVVGVVENGKYWQMTEDQKPAMFISYLQSPANASSIVVRSNRDPQQLAADIRTVLRQQDRALPYELLTWPDERNGPWFHPVWRLWRWGCSASWAPFWPSLESLASPRALSVDACAKSAFAWPSVRSAKKSWARRWAAQ